MKSCNGGVAKVCGSFLYLGSLTDNKGSSGPEIRRRIKKASGTFQKTLAGMDNEGIALGAKRSSVLGACPFHAIVSLRGLEHH